MTEGFDYREGRTIRQKMRLDEKDLKKLAKLVKKSGYEAIPEEATPFRPEGPRRTDSCDCSLAITLDGKEKRIHYDNGYDLPAKLEKLVRGIDAIVNGRSWEEDRYPWEEPASSATTGGKAP